MTGLSFMTKIYGLSKCSKLRKRYKTTNNVAMKGLPIRVFSLLVLISHSNGFSTECSFEVNGDSLWSLMLIEDEVDLKVNVSGSCELTILAVGGGGWGEYQGGGSGYLKYQKICLSTGITSLHAKAGGDSQSSSVIYDGTSIIAKHGQEGMSDTHVDYK